jgi:hypothetical protein
VTLEARVAQRVQRGVRWLNTHYPGWPRRITLKQFDFEDPCQCVVGFVCRTPERDAFSVFHERHPRADAERLGFDWGLESDYDTERQALSRAWQVAIRVAREGLRGRA